MHRSGLFDQAAAEIVAHDAWTQRLFVVNAASGLIDVLDVRAPARPTFMLNVYLGGTVNSVAAHQGLIAVAVENVDRTAAGWVTFFTADGRGLAVFIGLERVGGIMVYDVTNPKAPNFAQYLNYRNFGAAPETVEALDLGPEGIRVIAHELSPLPGGRCWWWRTRSAERRPCSASSVSVW